MYDLRCAIEEIKGVRDSRFVGWEEVGYVVCQGVKKVLQRLPYSVVGVV